MKCQRCWNYSWILYKYTYYNHRELTILLCPRCTKIAMTYAYEITVGLRGPGDFGYVSMSGVYRSPWDEKTIANNIKSSIKRHVDNVGSVSVEFRKYTPEEFWYKDVRINKKRE